MTNRTRTRRWLVVSTLAWLMLLSLPAAAQDWLHWHAPPGCPDRAAIERLLERSHRDQLELTGSIQRDNAGYTLHLSVRRDGQRFERSLHAHSCDVLAESTVFLVELAATQLSAAAPAEPPKVESALPARASAARVSAAAADQAEPDTTYLSSAVPQITHADPGVTSAADSSDSDAQSPLHLLVGVGAAATDVGLSGVGPQLAADIVLNIDAWSFGLRLGLLLHPTLSIGPDAELALRSGMAQLLACRSWRLDNVLLGPCAIVSGLYTIASASGLREGDTTASSSWLAGGAGFQLYLRLTRVLRLGAELGAWATLSARPSFEVSGMTVARADTLAGYARIAALFELW